MAAASSRGASNGDRWPTPGSTQAPRRLSCDNKTRQIGQPCTQEVTARVDVARRKCSARASHLGVAEQHSCKIFRGATNVHLLEVIVPTGCSDLALKFALKLSARHKIDAKKVVRRTAIRLVGVPAVSDDVDTGGFQSVDGLDNFLDEIGPLVFRAFAPGRTVV